MSTDYLKPFTPLHALIFPFSSPRFTSLHSIFFFRPVFLQLFRSTVFVSTPFSYFHPILCSLFVFLFIFKFFRLPSFNFHSLLFSLFISSILCLLSIPLAFLSTPYLPPDSSLSFLPLLFLFLLSLLSFTYISSFSLHLIPLSFSLLPPLVFCPFPFPSISFSSIHPTHFCVPCFPPSATSFFTPLPCSLFFALPVSLHSSHSSLFPSSPLPSSHTSSLLFTFIAALHSFHCFTFSFTSFSSFHPLPLFFPIFTAFAHPFHSFTLTLFPHFSIFLILFSSPSFSLLSPRPPSSPPLSGGPFS